MKKWPVVRDVTRDEDYVSYMTRRALTHPVVVTFAEQRRQFLQDVLALAGPVEVLDLGCGHGLSSAAFPNATAVDRSHALLRQHPAARRVQAVAETLPFPARRFDVVMLCEVLHHVEDATVVLREAARVSRRWVVAFEPNPRNPLIALAALVVPNHRHVLRWDARARIGRAFRRAGLEARIYTGGWLMPNGTPQGLLPLLNRLPYAWRGGVSLIAVGRSPGIRPPLAGPDRIQRRRAITVAPDASVDVDPDAGPHLPRADRTGAGHRIGQE